MTEETPHPRKEEPEVRHLSREEFKKLKPGPVRHEELTPELTERARSLYERVGHLMYSSFEQWELGFCRDTHPEREIMVWEAIADALEAYLTENPDAIIDKTLGQLVSLSMGAEPKTEDAKTRRLEELLKLAWESE